MPVPLQCVRMHLFALLEAHGFDVASPTTLVCVLCMCASQKLVDSGVTMDQLRAMDDAALRKAGVVVKSQRDKILAAVGA